MTTPSTPPPTPATALRRKRGAQPGNQNARKRPLGHAEELALSHDLPAERPPAPRKPRHPFDFSHLTPQQDAVVNAVLAARDLRPEIGYLRLAMARLLADPATKPSDLVGAARALAGIMRTHHRMNPRRARTVRAVENAKT